MVICLERGANCSCVVQLMPLPSQTPSSHIFIARRRADAISLLQTCYIFQYVSVFCIYADSTVNVNS